MAEVNVIALLTKKAEQGYTLDLDYVYGQLKQLDEKGVRIYGNTLKKLLAKMCATNTLVGESNAFKPMEVKGRGFNEFAEKFAEFACEDDSEYIDDFLKCWDEEKKQFSLRAVSRFANMAAKAEKKEDDGETSDADLIKSWKNCELVSGNIGSTVSQLVDDLLALYGSGIEAMPQTGIFVGDSERGVPLLTVKSVKEEGKAEQLMLNNVDDSGTMMDIKILRTLLKRLPNIERTYTHEDRTGFPSYAELCSGTKVMDYAHLLFQSCNVILSGNGNNLNSITRWAGTLENGKDGKTWLKEHNYQTKIVNKKDAGKWFTWVLTNQIYRYLDADGLKVSDLDGFTEAKQKFDWLDRVDAVCTKVAAGLRNVVAVAERVSRKKKLETTELRILSEDVAKLDKCDTDIVAALNTGNARGITATLRGNSNPLICTIAIVYDPEAAKKTKIFAGDIVDLLLAGGNRPSWSRALLGRKQDGSYMWWDQFMGEKASDRAYAIYAGSGGGKGIMTLTLMAAALCDNRKVFYTDGKPDSGASIGRLAWEKGHEAYMFDGQAEGGNAYPGILEANPAVNGMRDENETLTFKESVPIGLFSGDSECRVYLGVCRYLRSLDLCADWLLKRGHTAGLKDWQVWVVDEMTAMAVHESEVRQIFSKYVTDKGYTFGITMKTPANQPALMALKPGDKLNKAMESDKILAYINDWLIWTSNIPSKFLQLSKIELRNAAANVFFIFQNAEWCANASGKNKDKSYAGCTVIAKIVRSLSCRKFIGNDGLADECGDYGDGTTKKRQEYATAVNTGSGWWAVTDGVDARSSQWFIFKPYNVYGFADPKYPPEPDETHYLGGYAAKLLGGDDKAALILQQGYDDACEYVKELGYENIKQYIYDVRKFCKAGEQFDPSSLTNEGEGDDEASGYAADRYNKVINPLSQTDGGATNVSFDSEGGSDEGSTGGATTYDFGDDEQPVNMNDYENLYDPDVDEAETDTKSAVADDLWSEDFTGGSTASDAEAEAYEAEHAAEEDEFFGGGTEGRAEETPIETRTEARPQPTHAEEPDDDRVDVDPTSAGATGAVTRASKEQATKQENGKVKIDLNKTEKSTPAATLDKGNSIKIAKMYDANQLERIMDSPRKYDKFLDNIFYDTLRIISKRSGGRLQVRIIEIHTNELLANKKLVYRPEFDVIANGRNPMLELISFADIFDQFPKLNVLILDKPMFAKFEEQIEPLISADDINDGIEDAAHYVLKHNASINTINVIGLPPFKKADLLAKERAENMRLKKERAAQRTERGLATRLEKVRKVKKLPSAPKRTFNGKGAAKKIAGVAGRGILGGLRGIVKGLAWTVTHLARG